MLEIKEKTQAEIQRILLQYMSAIHAELIHSHDDVFLAEKILSIESLAIVDRDAELPEDPYKKLADEFRRSAINPGHYAEAQQNMLKAGYILEVKE